MRALRPRLFVSTGVLLVLLACAGCAQATDSAPSSSPTTQQPTVAYECDGRPIDAARYDSDVRADELTGDAAVSIASVVDDAGASAAPADPGEWVVTAESSTSITLLRPLGVADATGADHHVLVFEQVGDLPATGEPGWMLMSSSACTLTIDPAPLAPVDLNLDPAELPAPDATQLALLVTERACNGGSDATGRVELIDVEETADAVIVHIAVRPSGADSATCQSNPPTPFTVELESPLGEREIRDGGMVVPHPLEGVSRTG